MSALVTARDVTYRYPGAETDALAGVSLQVRPGEVVVLAGPSGGGKSTLLRALAGLVPHFHGGRFGGRVVVGGLDTRTASSSALARQVGIAFQDPEAQGVYARVDRDVAFGLENLGLPRDALGPTAEAALERVDAGHLADRTLDTLSGGERQRVALAGVLAPRPPLLLLDEPTAQLDDAAADRLAELLGRLAGDGLAVVVAEHRVDRVAAVATSVVGVEDGRLTDWHAREPAAPADRRPDRADGRPPLLRATDLEARIGGRTVLADVDLTVPPGRVLAVLGPNGAGKTTLLRALAGLQPLGRGRVEIGGVDVTAEPPERRYPGVALVVQDPGRHLLCERVDDEISFGLRALDVPEPLRRARAAEALAALDLGGLAARHPRDLSAGQRERVALAAALAVDPKVLLLDEPTRGMDHARRAALAALLRRRAADGRSALVVTHDRSFAAAAADELLELRAGRLRPGPVVVGSAR